MGYLIYFYPYHVFESLINPLHVRIELMNSVDIEIRPSLGMQSSNATPFDALEPTKNLRDLWNCAPAIWEKWLPKSGGEAFNLYISVMRWYLDWCRRVIKVKLASLDSLCKKNSLWFASLICSLQISSTPIMAAMHEDDSPDLERVRQIMEQNFQVITLSRSANAVSTLYYTLKRGWWVNFCKATPLMPYLKSYSVQEFSRVPIALLFSLSQYDLIESQSSLHLSPLYISDAACSFEDKETYHKSMWHRHPTGCPPSGGRDRRDTEEDWPWRKRKIEKQIAEDVRRDRGGALHGLLEFQGFSKRGRGRDTGRGGRPKRRPPRLRGWVGDRGRSTCCCTFIR